MRWQCGVDLQGRQFVVTVSCYMPEVIDVCRVVGIVYMCKPKGYVWTLPALITLTCV